MKQHTPPLSHQKECVKQVHRFGGSALIADEQGLGKTYEALLSVFLWERSPAIVVCPASLKWTWNREAWHHLRIRSLILNGRKPDKRTNLKGNKLVILNYQILEAWLPYLEKMEAGTLIVDECQGIKNRTTKSYKNVRRLLQHVPHFLALSGTPLTNRPSELWPVLNLLCPKEWPNFHPFAMEHCKPQRKPWGMTYNGAEKLPKLHRKMIRHCMIRRRKKEVLDLPEKIHSVVPLPLKNRKEYDKAETQFLRWLKETVGLSAAKKAQRAGKIVETGYHRRLAAKHKIPAVIDWIDDFLSNSDKKLVLMGCHQIAIQPLYKKYKNITVLVDGSVRGEKRQYAVDSFQNKKEKRLFIGNIQAAGVGLTLTAASHLAFFELDWTPGNMMQASDRVHRIGQNETTNIYYLVAENTIEERIANIIQSKASIVGSVLDGKNAETLDVHSLLLESLT